MKCDGFLPKKGNYKMLLSYQKAVIIFDCTNIFCSRFFQKYDRTIDQMVQAARSGKQNIIEGSKAGLTSAETEIKLANVARSSLEELLEDYKDFLRSKNLVIWSKDDEKAIYVRGLGSLKIPLPNATTRSPVSEPTDLEGNAEQLRQIFAHFLETRSSDVGANIMICLINQCNYLLDRQIKKLEEDFVNDGGIRERMFQARQRNR